MASIFDKSCKNLSRLRFASYDSDLYINEGVEVFKTYVSKKTKVKNRIPLNGFAIEKLVKEVVARGVILGDDSYDTWLAIGFAVAHECGEAGRSIFHSISSVSSKYDSADSDRQYDECLSTGNGDVTAGTLFKLAKDAGIDFSKIIHPDTGIVLKAAKNAKKDGRTQESVIAMLKDTQGIDEAVSGDIVKKVFAGEIDFRDIQEQKYFEKKIFIPQFLSQDILNDYKFLYTSKRFWQYFEGYWQPIDSDVICDIAQQKLDKHSRNNRISETVNHVKLSVLFKRQLDKQSEFINLKNGMFNWVTKEFLPHSENYYSTVRINANQNPDSKCPKWLKFLGEVLEPDTIVQIQELFGYCLVPETWADKAFMFTGSGANGKGTILHVLIRLLGRENVSEIPLQKLGDRFQTAELEGKLANIFTDLNSESFRDTGYFKILVSGDPITVERKHCDPYSINPYCRMIFSCNEIPRSYDRTFAYYRRWIIIPFNNTFTKENADKTLKLKLFAEIDGIHLWALEGLHRLFKQQDFSESKTANEMLEQYKISNDNVVQFVNDCCVIGDGYMVGKMDLYDAYKDFCNENSLRNVSQRRFNKDISDNNKSVYRTLNHLTNKKAWKGIGLNGN